MRIHTDTLIHHPLERVYAAYRDELPALAEYIPDIREIVVEKREERDGGVDIHNVWVAEREVPVYARAFLKPEMLRWDDYADWRDQETLVNWRIATRVFTDAVECAGTNSFVAEGEGATRLTLEGDLAIDLRHIPGVPRLLAGGLRPKVEGFIVSLITPNLERVNASLQRYLDEH